MPFQNTVTAFIDNKNVIEHLADEMYQDACLLHVFPTFKLSLIDKLVRTSCFSR